MISRPADTKFIFESSLHSEETFFPCRCDIFRFFEFLLLGNSSTAPVFSYNRINKQPENLYLNYRERFGYSTQLAETSLFNNAILHLNEIIKKRTLSSFEIILERVLKVFALHSAMRKPCSVRALE